MLEDEDLAQLDARHAAVLQVMAEELRGLIRAQGEGATAIAAWPSLLERAAAEILVATHSSPTHTATSRRAALRRRRAH